MLRAARIVRPYGSWPSPITSEFLTQGNCKSICELQLHNGNPFWIEQTFPAGVRVLYERLADKSIVQWSPSEISVSNSVYEYGGGSFCVSDAGVVISTRSGLFHLEKPKCSRPLLTNNKNEDFRYADLFPYENYVFAVVESHNTEDRSAEPINYLARVRIDTGEIAIVVQGADFYAEPRVSPDGRFLVWMQWNKPNMPWDKTSIWIAELSQGTSLVCNKPRKLVGDDACYFAPQWNLNSNGEVELYANADVTGFWNVYRLNIAEGGLLDNICPLDMDLAQPLWNLGDDRAYAVKSEDVVITLDHKNPVIWHKRSDTYSFQPIDTLKNAGFTVFSFLTISSSKLFCVASGPKRPNSLVEVDLGTYAIDVVRETRSLEELDRLPLSLPIRLIFDSDGVEVEGYYYHPLSLTHCGDSSPPPVVFLAHPGPTTRTTDALDLKKQYYTTRGFAVFDINYRGSTGLGTEFRNYLLGNWGVVDAADMVNGAKHLVSKGLANPEQMCIIGSSAGGYLVFSALMHSENPFKVGSSIYGVMDLLDLLKGGHKFEADYTIQLVAPYPEKLEIYKSRSAIYNLDKINTPVAFFHGTNDPVVDVNQSKTGFEELRKKGIPTFLQLFEGEGHGFRSKEAVTKTTDLTYLFFCRVLSIKPAVDCEINIFNLRDDKRE